MHVIKPNIDGRATETDSGASAPVGPSVITPLIMGLIKLGFLVEISLGLDQLIVL